MTTFISPTKTSMILDLARCTRCGHRLDGQHVCPGCGQMAVLTQDIFESIGELSGNNAVAASFYDGQGWIKFRPWERLFLRLVGGREKARGQILQHLPQSPAARILEVGIGDGENLDLLPNEAEVYGVDIARTQLLACKQRHALMENRLAWAEAEVLPFPDATFDASYTIGGFNYFRDPERAADEMRRVTKANGVVLIADERPDLKRYGLGHLIGFPAYDAWWMRRLGLPDEFVAMILRTQIDPDTILERLSPSAHRIPIWKGLGYLLVDTDPTRKLS